MATVPSPHDFSAGDYPTAAQLDTYKDGINWFLANRPLTMLRQVVTQSLFTSTWTPIKFTTEDLDRDGSHVGSGGSEAIFQAKTVGWYRFSGGVEYASNTTGFRAACFVKEGGSPGGTDTFGYNITNPGSATQWGVPAGSVLIYLDLDETVELNGIQSSGGSLSTSLTLGGSWMAAEWVGS